jgi:hypothetical protein
MSPRLWLTALERLPERKSKMKPLLLLTASILALASAGAFAQVSPTDRLAVSSGVSLWQSAWKSAGKTDLVKLQPLYGKNVLTRTTEATDQVKRTWVEFANVVRDRSSDVAVVIAGDKEEPKTTVVQDRLVTTFSSGVRLVWEKTNGVWKIVEQNLPVTQASMTALAE